MSAEISSNIEMFSEDLGHWRDPRRVAALRRTVKRWFIRHQRPLPWRVDYDPYQVWVSEMMLQQTQVNTVLPYYRRWMERFPTVEILAAAPLSAVLKSWEGLGYYARARNLHKAARMLVETHGGRMPAHPELLRALPGIGAYTAGAIASIAFNRPEPLVDGNAARVLSRLAALDVDPRSGEGQSVLWRLAGAVVPSRDARTFNQGLMELGALVCRPSVPDCPRCPLRRLCGALAMGDPTGYPRTSAKKARTRVHGVMGLVVHSGAACVRQRPENGLWGGLWEFPWMEREPGATQAQAAKALLTGIGLPEPSRARRNWTVCHGLTHLEFHLQCRLYVEDARPRQDARRQRGIRWVTRPEWEALPASVLAQKAAHLIAEAGAW